MHNAVKGMLSDYSCGSTEEYSKALVEILQEVLLLGLQQSGFLEKAAFFGGTALRVLHGLDRRCDSLDFCLLKHDPGFSIMEYADAVKAHLKNFGFTGELRKGQQGGAELTGVTRTLMQEIGAPKHVLSGLHPRKLLKLPINVDATSGAGFATEEKFLQRPVPFPVTAVSLPDAFAWNIHALLSEKGTAHGSDWFDFAWFVVTFPELRLSQLEAKLRLTGDYGDLNALTLDSVQMDLLEKVKVLDIETAREEALTLSCNRGILEDWSREYLIELIKDIEPV